MSPVGYVDAACRSPRTAAAALRCPCSRGAQATFTFSGTAVRWLGYRDEWAGIARVYLDGALRSTVDTFASPSQAQATLFSAADLGPGAHALRIEVTGTHHPQSAGNWLWLDAFEAVARTEQDGAAVTLTGELGTPDCGPAQRRQRGARPRIRGRGPASGSRARR